MTAEPAEDLMDRLNNDGRFSAEALALGEDVREGARGRVRVHSAPAATADEEFAETVLDVADDLTPQPLQVEEVGAQTVDLWMFPAE